MRESSFGRRPLWLPVVVACVSAASAVACSVSDAGEAPDAGGEAAADASAVPDARDGAAPVDGSDVDDADGGSPSDSGSDGSDAAPLVDAGSPIVASGTVVGGKTYAEWSAAWVQWDLAIPEGQNPQDDPTGAFCNQSQTGPVSPGGPQRRGVGVGHSCLHDSTWQAPAAAAPLLRERLPLPRPRVRARPRPELEQFLADGAKAALGNPTNLLVELDGVSYKADAVTHRFTSPLFDFIADPSLNAWDSCFTNTSQPAVTDGYWLMFKPLTPGTHKLHFFGTSSAGGAGFSIETTYDLTVQ